MGGWAASVAELHSGQCSQFQQIFSLPQPSPEFSDDFWRGLCYAFTQWAEHCNTNSRQEVANSAAAVDLARINDYQQLAERVAEATKEEWQAELPTETSRSQPKQMHPMHAATALLQGATDTVEAVYVSSMNKAGRNPGFYLAIKELKKPKVVKQKTAVDKHSFFEVLEAMSCAEGVSQDVGKAMKGLRGAIKAVLPAALQPKLHACCDKCQRKHCPLCMAPRNV